MQLILIKRRITQTQRQLLIRVASLKAKTALRVRIQRGVIRVKSKILIKILKSQIKDLKTQPKILNQMLRKNIIAQNAKRKLMIQNIVGI